jgi:hypothetical protein
MAWIAPPKSLPNWNFAGKIDIFAPAPVLLASLNLILQGRTVSIPCGLNQWSP